MKKEKKKLTLKQKEERKQAIKKWLLMTLHLISYILAVGFIIVLIIGLVGSCDKQPSTQTKQENHLRLDNKRNAIGQYNDSIDYSNGYFLPQWEYGATNIDKHYLCSITEWTFKNLLGRNVFTIDTPATTIYYNYDMSFPADTYMYKATFSCSSVTTHPTIIASVNMNYLCVWRDSLGSHQSYMMDLTIYYTYASWASPSYIDSYDYYFDQNPSCPYMNISSDRLIGDYVPKSLLMVSYFVPSGGSDGTYKNATFEFNDRFNYNAPKNQSVEYSDYENAPTALVDNDGVLKIMYDLPTFISNNKYFNRISVYYENAEDLWILVESGSVESVFIGETKYVQVDTGDYLYYHHMTFDNTNDNTSVIVNTRNFKLYNENANAIHTTISNSTSWKSNFYRTLKFDSNLTSSQVEDLTQFNNNSGATGFYDNSVSVGTTALFNMFTSAFDSLSSVLQIELWAGLTIGGLLFAPLVLTIVLVVIRMLKK